jgi:diaminohydroxyphosphoribosylaminopyrimidine deaminase/5-amino-6-(5-phosphoribosylamino)uracil reductase
MTIDQQYMFRCLELAKLGTGYVAPNPMVGAVLVCEGRIIGEGWHQEYGKAHAEVNCIQQAIENGLGDMIKKSILYVSLEPCAHFGKTPPCADLIIANSIPKVVIGSRDPFSEVNGKGIEKLLAAGIEVETGVLEQECRELNKRFFTFHRKKRPYILLKWAQTNDGYIAPLNPPQGGILKSQRQRLFISSEYSNRLVHQWRSEEAAILVGTNTALLDDPELTTRLWHGPSPVRLVIDMSLRLPESLKVFDGSVKTIVFNGIKEDDKPGISFIRLDKGIRFFPQLMNALYQLQIQSVLVEGGAATLQTFIDNGIWDEARIIVNNELSIGNGLSTPVLNNEQFIREEIIGTDTITYFRNIKQHNL